LQPLYVFDRKLSMWRSAMQNGNNKTPRARFRPRMRQLTDRKNSNSQKHGVYCHVAILPGEDPSAYAALYDALLKEWEASGPSEEDAVASIAKAMWRKARHMRFQIGKVAACTVASDHPAFDVIKVLHALSDVLNRAPDCADEFINRLPQDLKQRLREKFVSETFESIKDYALSMQNEINSVILPEIERFGSKPVEVSYFESTAIMTPEDFEHEIGVEERCDAIISQAIKRLMLIKGMKQMMPTQNVGKKETSERLVNQK
jgi:hypothetical protein